MKYYLSSQQLGNHADILKEFVQDGVLAVVPNAVDHIPESDRAAVQARNIAELEAIGVRAEVLQLQDFFSAPHLLPAALSRFVGVWVTGGNTFVLRQAMRLSGFDLAIKDFVGSSFLYGGYSAGICVLAPDLNGITIVDRPNEFFYPGITEPIWEGLGLLDYIILPHYQSDHPESADIERDAARCRDLGIPFATLRDGEVLWGEDLRWIRSLQRG